MYADSVTLRYSCTQIVSTHLQRGPHCHNKLEPGRKLVYCFTQERHNGVSVVRLVELCLIKSINEDDQVFFRGDLPL